MDFLDSVLTLNNILGIVLLVQVILQDRRGRGRDRDFKEVILSALETSRSCQQFVAELADKMIKVVEQANKSTPRN